MLARALKRLAVYKSSFAEIFHRYSIIQSQKTCFDHHHTIYWLETWRFLRIQLLYIGICEIDLMMNMLKENILIYVDKFSRFSLVAPQSKQSLRNWIVVASASPYISCNLPVRIRIGVCCNGTLVLMNSCTMWYSTEVVVMSCSHVILRVLVLTMCTLLV